ncbi:MAG: class I SAM-dependent methyltransferase [Ferruginibacter sp.]
MADAQKEIVNYTIAPIKYLPTPYREIADFTKNETSENIDLEVVKSFGEEWNKFHKFSKKTISKIYNEYFDIIDEQIVNKDTYMIDIGCGSGRWSEYFLDKAAFIEAIDPSDAVYAADELLGNSSNVRITRASINTLPWPDETFDFGMSVGVLHHIPDTQLALNDCVKKIKTGGHFYVYLYYKLDNRGFFFKSLFYLADLIRRVVSKLPSGLKKITCDLLAVFAYMPFILFCRLLMFLGLKKTAQKIPLYAYTNKDFYIIRNDSLDRFGTRLEQRFTKDEIEKMMTKSGLINIKFGNDSAYWHAVGKKA